MPVKIVAALFNCTLEQYNMQSETFFFIIFFSKRKNIQDFDSQIAQNIERFPCNRNMDQALRGRPQCAADEKSSALCS